MYFLPSHSLQPLSLHSPLFNHTFNFASIYNNIWHRRIIWLKKAVAKLEFYDDKKNELQKKEEIITEAIDTLFQSSAFGNLINGFQNLINSSLKVCRRPYMSEKKILGCISILPFRQRFEMARSSLMLNRGISM